MMRDIRVKRLAFAAVSAAFSAVFLALTGVLPAARIAFLVISGLFPFAGDLILGRRYSIPAFFAGGLLGFLFGAGYAGGLAFLVLFGSYPIFRNFLAGKNGWKKAPVLALKLFWFLAASGILLAVARTWLLPDMTEYRKPLYIVLILFAGIVLFLLYDLLLGMAAGWIFRRFDRLFRSLF